MSDGFESLTPDLVAPCGMNCGVCRRYLAYSKGVPEEKGKLAHCQGCLQTKRVCYIKRDCRGLRKGEVRFCYECAQFACRNIEHLDERYRKQYAASVIENLEELRRGGMEAFMNSQEERYRCLKCGSFISIHDGKCYGCGFKKK